MHQRIALAVACLAAATAHVGCLRGPSVYESLAAWSPQAGRDGAPATAAIAAGSSAAEGPELTEQSELPDYLAYAALNNAGLGAVHGFAAPLGANFPVPHGVVCGALLPHVMAANVAALRAEPSGAEALGRYAAVGRALCGEMPTDEKAIDAGIAFVGELVRELEIPPLSAYGLDGGCIAEMASLARRAGSMKYNPVDLGEEALADVLQQAIGSPA